MSEGVVANREFQAVTMVDGDVIEFYVPDRRLIEIINQTNEAKMKRAA